MNNTEFQSLTNLELQNVYGGDKCENIISGILAGVGTAAAITGGSPLLVITGCFATGYYLTKACK